VAQTIALVPLVIAAVMVLSAWSKSTANCCDKLGPPGWSFSTSWASNLTVVLAVFQMLFAQNLLSDAPYMPKTSYAALAAMFGALLIAGPFVYLGSGLLSLNDKKEVQVQGRVWGFLLGATLVLWAVVGQLLETVVLSFDVARGGLDTAIACVFNGLSIAILAVAIWHGWRTVHFVLVNLHAGTLREMFHRGQAPAWPLP
jgi:hypothetical protein